ncbi:MAG: UDP-3-O-(3-hydroxymyristoyl)glucosamine N-acyltransferase [Legionellales bacterium]|nr:UDP-3-O-(3-hydroxymyristoyl)glucosamine N-acyltransferase [Legionellales bacterium]
MKNNKKYTLAELAELLSAQVQGDTKTEIVGIASLQTAKPGEISFLDNSKYRQFLAETQASAVILSAEMAPKSSCPVLIVADPYLAYAKTAALFEEKPISKPGIHPQAVIGEHCEIDPSASIGANVVIGNSVKIGKNSVIQPGCVINDKVVIGDDCWFWPNVTIYHATCIGSRTIIHSGAVLGSDGFGFAFNQGRWHKIPQIGCVIVGNDVEIGANTTIDRGALTDTVIGNGVKMDNQIQIGHNVQIGDHTVIAAGTGISGSTKIGKYCRIAGMVGFAGHIEITDQVVITAMSSVAQSITEPGIYSSGIPAGSFKTWKKNIARFLQLDNLARRLIQVERVLAKQDEEKPS